MKIAGYHNVAIPETDYFGCNLKCPLWDEIYNKCTVNLHMLVDMGWTATFPGPNCPAKDSVESPFKGELGALDCFPENGFWAWDGKED